MLGLPGTWQTGRSGFHPSHLRAGFLLLAIIPEPSAPAGGRFCPGPLFEYRAYECADHQAYPCLDVDVQYVMDSSMKEREIGDSDENHGAEDEEGGPKGAGRE